MKKDCQLGKDVTYILPFAKRRLDLLSKCCPIHYLKIIGFLW